MARFRFLVSCVIAAALAGCAHGNGAPATPASPAPAPAGEKVEVIAMVETMDHKIHTETMMDGSIYVRDVVGFVVVDPPGFKTLVMVNTPGHPRIGTRPLLLGDLVRFGLPPNWENADLAIEDLENLRFRDDTKDGS
jgi:hypothetical protein